MEFGTLYQLRNVLNRRNVVKSPTSNVTVCEEFFLSVVEAHIVTAAMTLFEMTTTNGSPSTTYFPDSFSSLTIPEQQNMMVLAINTLVHKFVDTGCSRQQDVKNDECDGVLAYTCGTLSMGLLFMEFGDAIYEGDGNGVGSTSFFTLR